MTLLKILGIDRYTAKFKEWIRNKFIAKGGLKTINGEPIEGIGNIVIEGGSGETNSPVGYGDVEHSAVLKGETKVLGVTYKNEALNEGCVSLGANSKAGLKGYYFTYIDFTANQIWLHDEQFTSRTLGSLGGWKKNSVSDANRCGWAKGDVISFTCNGHYDNSATIVNVVDNVITVDELPFTPDDIPSTIISIEEANNKFDECSVFCVKKFNIGTVELGGNAFAIGTNTQASNAVAYTEGYNTIAYGKYSHAEGNETEAGYNAHSEGYKTKALGERSHAEGRENIAEGNCSHVEGRSNKSNGDYSHAEGYGNIADGWGSHVEGQSSKANGITSHAEGYGTIANGEQSHAEGRETKTSETAKYSHAEGYKTLTEGKYSHAEGYDTTANGGASHAEGSSTEAGENAHSEGLRTKATGNNSHAEGQDTQATGTAAHAEGDSNSTEAVCSHVEGYSNKIYKDDTDSSHAEGEYNVVNPGAYASHVEGEYNEVNNRAEHASGQYNKSTKSNVKSKATHFSIGIGTSNERKNAFEVKQNGDILIAGVEGRIQDKLNKYDNLAKRVSYLEENGGGGKSKFQLYQENGGRFFTNENVYNIFDALRNECSDYYWNLEIETPLESGNIYTFDELDLTYWNFIGVVYDGRYINIYNGKDNTITLQSPGESNDSHLYFESGDAYLIVNLVAKTVEFNTWE